MSIHEHERSFGEFVDEQRASASPKNPNPGRQAELLAGMWVIQSYDREIDDRSASDTEAGAWDLFLERSVSSQHVFVADGWKAIKMPPVCSDDKDLGEQEKKKK